MDASLVISRRTENARSAAVLRSAWLGAMQATCCSPASCTADAPLVTLLPNPDAACRQCPGPYMALTAGCRPCYPWCSAASPLCGCCMPSALVPLSRALQHENWVAWPIHCRQGCVQDCFMHGWLTAGCRQSPFPCNLGAKFWRAPRSAGAPQGTGSALSHAIHGMQQHAALQAHCWLMAPC